MRTWGACTHPQRTRRWGWAPWWAPSHSTRRPSRRFPPSGVPRAFPQAVRRPVARGNEARGLTRVWGGRKRPLRAPRHFPALACKVTWGGGEGCPLNRRTMRRVRRNDGARTERGESLWVDGMKSAIAGGTIFGSISISQKRHSKAPCGESSKLRNPRSPVPGTPGGRDGSHPRVTFDDTLLADDRTSCRACITVPASALTYGSHWRGYSRWAPLLLHLRAPGRNFPHGRILDEHARTIKSPRQAPVNRSVSVSTAPVCRVGVTGAQPAVGSSRSRETTGNLPGNLPEIARSRRVRLCL